MVDPVRSEEPQCHACPLNGERIRASVPMRTDLAIVGEAPGRQEIRNGVPFIGPAGNLLNLTLAEFGVKREEVFVTNVVLCRPVDAEGKDAPPPAAAIQACSGRLKAELAAVRPKVTIAVGNTAAQTLLNTKQGITKVHGAVEYSSEYGCHIMPTYHPAAVLHGAHGFFDDIYDEFQRAIQFVRGDIPLPGEYNPPWTFVQEPELADAVLAGLESRADRAWRDRKQLKLSYDTESKPDHDQVRPLEDEFLMFQISDGEHSWSFRVPKIFAAIKERLSRLLSHSAIAWIMHNMTYDQQVSKYNVGVMVAPHLARDTMVLGLGLTERGEQVGLKAMSRRYLNAPFYEKELEEPCEEHGNKYSWKKGPQCECNWWALAKYGAFDAYNTWWLDEIVPPLVKAEGTMDLCNQLLLPAQDAFATLPGTLCDVAYAQGLETEWLPIIEAAESAIQEYAVSQGFPRDPSVVGAQNRGIPCPECIDDEVLAEWTPGPERKGWRQELIDLGFPDDSCKRCMKRRFVLVPDHRLNVRSPKQLHHLCLTRGHRITLASGQTKPIERLKVGDELLGFNEETGELEPTRVTRALSRVATDLIRVHFASGRAIQCTRDHPLHVPKRGGWIAAEELVLGDEVHELSDWSARGRIIHAPYGRCESCGEWVPSLEKDHRNALGEGGRNTPSNLQWLCIDCHSNKSREEQARMRKAYWNSASPERRAELSLSMQQGWSRRLSNGDAVISVEAGEESMRVYNISCAPHANYFARGLLLHNCFDLLRMPTPAGKRSVDENFFKYNAAHKMTELMLALREKDHLLRNYIRGISDDVWSDGLLHPDFLLFGTVTGRLSIRNPPMQTLPKWGTSPELAKMIRRMIVAKHCPRHVNVPFDEDMSWCLDCFSIVDIDYKNLELFVAHHYSGDPNLLHALTVADFHTMTASAIFEKPYEAVTGGDRFQSKFVTFGIAYGRQAYSLAQGELKSITGGNERLAQAYIDRFWGLYPQYKEMYDSWKYDAVNKGELRTPVGRVRRWKLITPQLIGHIENQAVNFPIQSLASDTCLFALIQLNRELPKRGWGDVLFTVHDSLVLQIQNRHLEEAIPYICHTMTHPPYETETPFAVEVEVGPNLGKVHTWQAAA